MRDPRHGRDWKLQRRPRDHDKSLRAWDTADEYLIKHCHENDLPAADASLLVVNDAFGALATAFSAQYADLWSDSLLSKLATVENLQTNALPDAPTFIPGDRTPTGPYDLVLLKLPKSLAHLEDQLLKLRGVLRPGAVVIAGGMIKHSPRRAYELLESCIGETRTSLGWRKARLAIAQFDAERELPVGLESVEYKLEGFDLTLGNAANVYAREQVDIGTRLLLKHLPRSDAPLQIADIGCGNGALSLALKILCPNAEILGTDESYSAIGSARDNARRADLDVNFEVDDCLWNTPAESFDLVVCNPPFHQGSVVGDQLAWSMFCDAHRTLKPGGELLIVGNAHLGYREKLLRLFGDCESIAQDLRFVVLKTTR
jgi:23S rRNA (guanine1835-N2)-methyltransferase